MVVEGGLLVCLREGLLGLHPSLLLPGSNRAWVEEHLCHLGVAGQGQEQKLHQREGEVLLPKEACPTHLKMPHCCLNQMNLFLLVVVEEVVHPLGSLVDSSLTQWLVVLPMEACCLVEEDVLVHHPEVVVGSYHYPS